MAFPKDTIRLCTAKTIFADAVIEEVLIGGKVAGYKATICGKTYEDTGLTALCETLWESRKK